MAEKTEPTIVDLIEAILPSVEKYRSKQMNKYHREKEMDYGGEHSKMEKYKNRTRVVDIFLPALNKFVNDSKKIKSEKIN